MSLDDIPDQIGPYRLERKIGAGGMGVVYQAVDTLLERPVAIKMMHGLHADSDDADELRSRFLLEARTAARIKSRHVVQILQLGVLPPATIYIVMEFLDGASLKAELKRAGAFPVARAVRIASDIAEAMALAHDLNVVHRDLKPANIMLVKEGTQEDVVKVLDFGIAKLTTTNKPLTQAGVVLGTLAFMAPEQIDSQPIDGRTDLYALGMVLYRMLTGRAAYDSESAAELVHLQRTVLPPAPSVRAPERRLPTSLDDVVMRCLQKAPADRWPSMRALIEALRPFRDLPDAQEPDGPSTLEVARPTQSILTETDMAPAHARRDDDGGGGDLDANTAITSDAGSAVFTLDGVRPSSSALSMAPTLVSSRSLPAVGEASPSTPTAAPLAETSTLPPPVVAPTVIAPPTHSPSPSPSPSRLPLVAAVALAVVVLTTGIVVTRWGGTTTVPDHQPPATTITTTTPPAMPAPPPEPLPVPATPAPTSDPTPEPPPEPPPPPPEPPLVVQDPAPPPPPHTTTTKPVVKKKKKKPPSGMPVGFEPVHTVKAP